MKTIFFSIAIFLSATVLGQSFEELVNNAALASKERRYQDAVELYKKALKLDPENYFILNRLSLMYNHLSDLDSSILYSNKTLLTHPNDTIALYYRGHSYMDKNQYDKAVKDFTRSYELTNYKNADACFNIGKCYSELGNFTMAIDYYKKTLLLQPNDKYSFYEIGYAYASLKVPQKNEALKYYTMAIEQDKNYYDPYFNRGLLYAAQFKDLSKAHLDLERSIEIRPKNKLSYIYDARLYSQQEEYGRAKDIYDKLIELHPDYGQAYLERAITWYHIGILNMVCKDFEKAESLGVPDVKDYKEKMCK